MTTSMDLNADLGEGCPNDTRLLDLVTSASISCGAHAGDTSTIQATLIAARSRGVVVGAHPGYPDREHFGRIEREIEDSQVSRIIAEQFEHLKSLAEREGVELRFIKPHGALYNQAQRDEQIARGVVLAVRRIGLPLLGQPGTILESTAAEFRVPFVAEGFPERRYDSDARLVPRSSPDAVLHEPAEIEAQVIRFLNFGMKTLCIHGDDPNAVAKAELVRALLVRHGVEPRFWGRTESS